MRAYPAALLALIAAFSGPLAADVIDLPAGAAVAPAQPLPAKGISMALVRQQFGAPLHKHPPVGGGSGTSRRSPAGITRVLRSFSSMSMSSMPSCRGARRRCSTSTN